MREANGMASDEATFDIKIRQTAGGTFTVSVSGGMTVLELKEKLKDPAGGVEPEKQRLIYQGHVLKDNKTLGSYNLKADHTVHLVKSVASRGGPSSDPSSGRGPRIRPADPAWTQPVTQPRRNQATVPATPAQLPPNYRPGGGQGGFGGLGGLGGMGGFDASQLQHVQEQLMRDPNAMNEMLNSPAMQAVMSNPEVMRTIMQSNPQMRDLMDRNPELAHILNDPETLRQTMEIARNPDLLREQMRTADRAMSNIESLPEGFNALRRMYENVQEPLMSMTTSAQDAASNPFAALRTNAVAGAGSGANAGAGGDAAAAGGDATQQPNVSPLPNPWAPPPAAGAGGGGAGAGDRRPGAGAGGMASLFGGLGLDGSGGIGGSGLGAGGVPGGGVPKPRWRWRNACWRIRECRA